LSCEYLREFSKKRNSPNGSGPWGKKIHVENLNLKISWHCPFNIYLFCRNSMSLIHGLNQTVRYGEEMEWRGDSREYSSVGSFMGQLYIPTTLLKKFSDFSRPQPGCH
jgi:hypothetical protein